MHTLVKLFFSAFCMLESCHYGSDCKVLVLCGNLFIFAIEHIANIFYFVFVMNLETLNELLPTVVSTFFYF